MAPQHVTLLQIQQDGTVPEWTEEMPDMVKEVCAQTAHFHTANQYCPPWIGYLSISQGQIVGGGGFKGAPKEGKVEIAYFTLPELEGQGYATATALGLVEIATNADGHLLISAQTLPETNPSNHLLQKIGFTFAGTINHPEDGNVWEWHLTSE